MKLAFIFLIFLIACTQNNRKNKKKFNNIKKQLITSSTNLTINQGETFLLSSSLDVNQLIINGTLLCDEETADNVIHLKAQSIIVNGEFRCGYQNNPYDKKIFISLKHSDLDPYSSDLYRGFIVMMGGKLNLYGRQNNKGWTRLSKNINPGDTEIFLAGYSQYNQVPWQIGDQIVVAPTGFDYLESETFTITGFDYSIPGKVLVQEAAQFFHWGENQNLVDPNYTQGVSQINFKENAEVANLTRNIVIRPDESNGVIDEGMSSTSQLGAHLVIHHGGVAKVDNVEFYKMGQAGLMGRYPFHWHHTGDASNQFIKNSSIHHTFQRCVTIHRTNHAEVRNNVCYNFKGHGYFLEDGIEQNNTIIKNLAITAKAPSSNKYLLESDNIGGYNGESTRFSKVSSFWISHPNNKVEHNVAAGSIGTGFWMAFEKAIRKSNGAIITKPLYSNTLAFNYNTAHSTNVGITWDGAPDGSNTNNPRNNKDKTLVSAHYSPSSIPTFKGLKAYKNIYTGIYFRGQTAVFQDSILADNGWSIWVAYNQIFYNTIFIGKTQNSSTQIDDYYFANTKTNRYRKSGIVLYDGPFEVHNASFLNFSTSPETYFFPNGSQVNSVVVPFSTIGGTNKFTNMTSQLSFSPEPIHRIHLHDSHEIPKERHLLGNGSIRDVDGTLANTNQQTMIVSTRSLGVLESSNCTNGGTSHYNFKLCPYDYEEGAFYFMVWNVIGGYTPYKTPFIVRRNDGLYSYPQSEWAEMPDYPNNLFHTDKEGDYLYELLPHRQYHFDKSINGRPRVEFNKEMTTTKSPIVKFLAYGKNCKLKDGALQVYSITQLQQATQTSYYTSGEDFYVRVLTDSFFDKITNSSTSIATGYQSDKRFLIECDNQPISKKVKGKITQVAQNSVSTVVKGWACNYTHDQPIEVKIYAKHINNNSSTLLDTKISNLSSTPDIAFKCGTHKATIRNFQFTLRTENLALFPQHTFHVLGISNSSGSNQYLDNSGTYSVY